SGRECETVPARSNRASLAYTLGKAFRWSGCRRATPVEIGGRSDARVFPARTGMLDKTGRVLRTPSSRRSDTRGCFDSSLAPRAAILLCGTIHTPVTWP